MFADLFSRPTHKRKKKAVWLCQTRPSYSFISCAKLEIRLWISSRKIKICTQATYCLQALEHRIITHGSRHEAVTWLILFVMNFFIYQSKIGGPYTLRCLITDKRLSVNSFVTARLTNNPNSLVICTKIKQRFLNSQWAGEHDETQV